jgi:hypothetical protein
MVPEENLVFDPEASLRELVYWTHYLPGEWKGKLHSQMVSFLSLLFSWRQYELIIIGTYGIQYLVPTQDPGVLY